MSQQGHDAQQSDVAVSDKQQQQQQQQDENSSEETDPLHLIDAADRSMALKHWDQAADEYAQALDILRETRQEDAPELAPVLHKYGKSLLEYAIATSGALGGGGGQQDAPMPSRKKSKQGNAKASSSKQPTPADPRFSFSGDADDDDDEEEDDEEGGPAGQAGAEEDDADDLSVAFSVLDLVRLIYDRILHPKSSDGAAEGQEDPNATLLTIQGQQWTAIKVKNELAEVLNDLGDVGLESENFQQASSDYDAALQLLSPQLHPHSRRLADAYLRLGLALEFHPESAKQATAVNYVESAANVLRSRLDALQRRSEVLAKAGGSSASEAREQAAAASVREEKAQQESVEDAANSDNKGKGKGPADEAAKEAVQPVERDDVVEMDEVRVEREITDVREMVTELESKLEDIKAAGAAPASGSAGPSGSSSSPFPAGGPVDAASAKAALQQAINDAFLGASTNSLATPSVPSGPVNDLSAMVKKKKRPAPEEAVVGEDGNGKGKGKGKGKDVSHAQPTLGDSDATAAAESNSAKRTKVDDE